MVPSQAGSPLTPSPPLHHLRIIATYDSDSIAQPVHHQVCLQSSDWFSKPTTSANTRTLVAAAAYLTEPHRYLV